MSNSNTTFNDNSSYIIPSVAISDTIKFWCYLVFLIPSIACSLFILYSFLSDRTLRHALHNHVIIVVLLIGLIDELTIYIWMLYYYQHGDSWYRPPIFCTIWGFIDWPLYLTQLILFAWASIERHILIFYDGWVATKKKRFFVHYLPPIAIILHCLIFYIIVYFFPPCENQFDQSYMICIGLCFYENYIFTMWETIVHQILPNLTIVVLNIVLLLRVLWQKQRMRQPIQWRKHRKMTVQLISVSFLYFIFSFSLAVMALIQLSGLSFITSEVPVYATFLSYYLFLLFPFVCALSLAEFRKKLMTLLHLQRQARRIGPETFTIKPIVRRQALIH